MRWLVLVLFAAVLGCGDLETPVSPKEEARAELDRRGIEFTGWAFVLAASAGFGETVQLFVEAGMSVNTADNESGATALHGGARFGHLEIVKFLLSQGANISARDKRATRLLFGRQGEVICR